MENEVSTIIKCISCGEINLVENGKRLIDSEEKHDWTIKTTKTARRKFNGMCARLELDHNAGLLYLLALDVREQEGMLRVELDTEFGVPGTGTGRK